MPFGFLEFSRAKRRELCTYIRARTRAAAGGGAGLGLGLGLGLLDSGSDLSLSSLRCAHVEQPKVAKQSAPRQRLDCQQTRLDQRLQLLV